MSDDRFIYTGADVLGMLDDLLTDESAERWDEFHADRTRPIPFFTEAPDENLAEWLEEGLITPGRVLELGCGHGRNMYERASLGGGLGYTEDQLRTLWDAPPLTTQVLRPMRPQDEQSRRFGLDFLWALLAQRVS